VGVNTWFGSSLALDADTAVVSEGISGGADHLGPSCSKTYTESSPASVITPGSTWNFQAWFRDTAAGGSAFDLSDAVAVSFRP
jgi:hypothetical protein